MALYGARLAGMNDRRAIKQPRAATADTARAQIVTASALVRNFGTWQDRAMTAPVYILKRGRARLVMLAADLIEQMGNAPPRSDEWISERQPLLDTLREVVILLDEQRVIRFANSAAIAFFAASATGQPVERILPGGLDAFLIDVIERVQRSGMREQVEIALDTGGARPLSLAVIPLAQGVGLIGHDVTILHDLNTANAALSAVDGAFSVLTDLAKVRIDARGMLIRPTRSFAQMTGMSVEALVATQFINTIALASRVAVADAIEQAIASRAPTRVEGDLLVNGTAPQPVAIGLSPLGIGPVIEGVQAILIARK